MRFVEIHKSPYGDGPENYHLARIDDELHVELTYPKITKDGYRYVVFDQESIRASDSIRISFDYDRNGYKIESPTRLSWDSCAPDAGDMKWKESAFVPAWLYSGEEL